MSGLVDVNFESAEARSVLRLQETEASSSATKGGDAAYAKLWLELFLGVSLDECLRVRCEVASNLCFRRRDGALLDVEFARRRLSRADDARLLARLAAAAAASRAGGAEFRVVSALDDTIVPGGYSALGVAGCDTTAPAGSFYAGCAALHEALRPRGGGEGESEGEGGYSTLLTARPPRLVRALVASKRGSELVRTFGPRLGLLPGTAAPAEVSTNLKNILVAKIGERRRKPWASLAAYDAHTRRRYGGLADHKVKEFCDFASAYPDFNGRFVFIGDDHQGDYLVARRLLQLAFDDDGANRGLLAFCCIKHARNEKQPDALTPRVQVEMLDETRRAAGGETRFFIFETYHDLAAQLHAAGWIDTTAKNTIVEASAAEQVANDFFG